MYPLLARTTMHFITSSTDLYMKIDDNTIKTIIKTISVLFSCNLLKTVFVINIIKTKIDITGGRHRSVAIANEIYEELKASDYIVGIEHRDINEDINRGAKKL